MEKKKTTKAAAKAPVTKAPEAPSMKRTFTGTVVSTGMQKTITVKVDEMKLNKKYQKKFRISTKFHVHDEAGKAKVGDKVNFVECRPLSKTKRWTLLEVTK